MNVPRTVNGLKGLAFQALVKAENRNVLAFMFLAFSFLGGVSETWGQESRRASTFKRDHAWVDPLTIPPLLSGNFGELRGNHFHTGVDLKTEGREGLPVLAATDGRVARVKMSPWGYGNALYLEGPDGVTTVYAHLQRFAPNVQSWAVARTYEARSLGLDASPPSSAGLRFQAGDTLGWSGNSGGSGGPHLHFEIRSTSNQHPLNPLDGWLSKVDTRPPVIPALWVESATDWYRVSLPASDTLSLTSKVRFSVEGYDVLDGASNICGLRTLEAKVMEEGTKVLLTHRASWEELDFGVNKDMNAHAFYPVWSTVRDQVHRLHRFPTNRLGIYETPASAGWVELDAGQRAVLHIEAADAAGNRSSVAVPLVGSPPEMPSDPLCNDLDAQDHGEWSVEPELSGTHDFGEFGFAWRAGTFFERETVRVYVEPSGRKLRMLPTEVPYRKAIQVRWPVPSSAEMWEGAWSVLPGASLPADRWLSVQREDDGEVGDAVVAERKDGQWLVDLPRGGEWVMERDTVPPRVLPYHSGTPLVASGDAVWYVEDALAGIEDVELRIQGQWARAVWDPKRNMLTYEASDEIHPRGVPCPVSLTVTDEVGNTTTWERSLTWP